MNCQEGEAAARRTRFARYDKLPKDVRLAYQQAVFDLPVMNYKKPGRVRSLDASQRTMIAKAERK